ncbi:5-oxoprolinase subunit PxpB [Puia sp.]|jgi:inhibitor of KinA|uniref:5-oxoprolinase subunit PxpB n=1 Tax=Puia sp. TaxID=2045100 RepID=UPI002F41E672
MNRYSIFPLGDSGITIDLGNTIDEQLNVKALAIHNWLDTHPFPGRQDIIMAYSSVTMLYDPTELAASGIPGAAGAYEWLEGLLHRAWQETDAAGVLKDWLGEGRVVDIPVCYDAGFAPDMQWVATQKGLSPEEVIALHTGEVYRVYMLGFLPGFPYLGKLDQRLQISRKPAPVPVAGGGVGIAGMQTGIYSLNSPGGWQIIGRTPMSLFDRDNSPPVRLQAGDKVRFHAISAKEYRQLASRPA